MKYTLENIFNLSYYGVNNNTIYIYIIYRYQVLHLTNVYVSVFLIQKYRCINACNTNLYLIY